MMPQAQPNQPTPACKACGHTLSTAQNLGTKNGFDLLKCADCDSVTVSPFPTVEELIAFYQSYKGSTDYRAKEKRKIERATRRIRRLMSMTKGRTFLDVGCNYGFTVKAAQNLGLEPMGIDIDASAVADSKAAFGGDVFRTIAVEDYAAEGHKADIIYTSEVLEHVPDPDSFIKAISSLLAPGGVLYLTTPECGHWRIPSTFTDWPAVMPPEHITYFTRKGIAKLLSRHGLKVEKFFFSLKPGMRLIARRK